MNRNGNLGSSAAEHPRLGRGLALERDAIVRLKVVRNFRHPSLREICGTAANHAANHADATGDEAAVGEIADPHRQIDAVLQEIDYVVGEKEPDIDLRVS